MRHVPHHFIEEIGRGILFHCRASSPFLLICQGFWYTHLHCLGHFGDWRSRRTCNFLSGPETAVLNSLATRHVTQQRQMWRTSVLAGIETNWSKALSVFATNDVHHIYPFYVHGLLPIESDGKPRVILGHQHIPFMICPSVDSISVRKTIKQLQHQKRSLTHHLDSA